MTYFNRLRTAITNTPGTGNFSIGNAFPEYKTLIAADNGKSLDILIQEGTSWEIRKDCVFTFATLTLTRGTLVDSSTGGTISFTSAAIISNVLIAERVVPFSDNKTIFVEGSDSNIDLVLKPKGSGRVREDTKYIKSYSQDDGWMDVLPMFVKDDGTNGFSFGQIGATGRFALFCAGSGPAKTIYCLYHMPHDLKLSQTTSYFHLHWEPPNTNSGNIVVVVSIQAALRDGVWSSFYDHTFTLTPSGQVANRHVVTELQLDTNLNSYLEPDAMFFVKISRDPAAVADTYADQFYFHQADFHTQTDARNTTSKDKSTGWVKI